jgi:hypothetical protein
MIITADLAAGKLRLPGGAYPISCKVRSIRDGTRRSCEVIRSIPDGLPYDPLPFPKGLWRVTGVEWQKEKGFDPNTYGPVKIRTDAWRLVKVWELDHEGDYLRETEELASDTCYWLHYSPSATTLGCIRLPSAEAAAAIARIIARALEREPAELEVV